MAGFDEALEVPEEQEEKQEEVKEDQVEAKEETPEAEDPEKKQASEPEEEHKVPVSVMLKERDKAKEFKRELEELKNDVAQIKQVKSEENALEFDDNPEEYLAQRDQKILQALENKLYDMSVANAKRLFKDYDAKEALFVEQAKKDPTLGQKMAQAADPALYVYEAAKSMELKAKYGENPEDWRKALKDEVRAEVEAELKGKTSSFAKAGAKQPSNINDIRAAGGDSKPDYKPASFDDALIK